jgi:hypothetical protein
MIVRMIRIPDGKEIRVLTINQAAYLIVKARGKRATKRAIADAEFDLSSGEAIQTLAYRYVPDADPEADEVAV